MPGTVGLKHCWTLSTNGTSLRNVNPRSRIAERVLIDAMLHVRSDRDAPVARRLRDTEVRDIAEARVWREFRWHKNQPHYPGSYWAATMQAFVGYESRLELSCLLLEDFDPAVTWIRSQPFLLEATVGAKTRRHVPDYMLEYRDGTVCVVDVKPRTLLADPKIAEALTWSGRVIESRGWRYRVATEPDPVVLSNVRFLAGYRRSAQFATHEVDRADASIADRATFGQAIRAVSEGGADLEYARALVLRLLWLGRLHWDTATPLGRATILEKK